MFLPWQVFSSAQYPGKEEYVSYSLIHQGHAPIPFSQTPFSSKEDQDIKISLQVSTVCMGWMYMSVAYKQLTTINCTLIPLPTRKKYSFSMYVRKVGKTREQRMGERERMGWGAFLLTLTLSHLSFSSTLHIIRESLTFSAVRLP